MLPKIHKKSLNKKGQKWLALLFVASLLVNAQAGVVCVMMPDMSEQQAECCFGVDHRPTVSIDSTSAPAAMDTDTNRREQGLECDDPRRDCCMFELSLGINDPPTSDEALTFSSKTTKHHQAFKQLDNSPAVAELYSFEAQVKNTELELPAILPDSFLHQYAPPLYKTTERYRI